MLFHASFNIVGNADLTPPPPPLQHDVIYGRPHNEKMSYLEVDPLANYDIVWEAVHLVPEETKGVQQCHVKQGVPVGIPIE